MTRVLKLLALNAVILTLAAAPVSAQTGPEATRSPGRTAPARRAESAPKEKQIEGAVQRVDAAAKTIDIGGPLGRATLQVTDTTLIRTLGQRASLKDIAEGVKVQVSYEAQDGRNVARSIEVLPAVASLVRGGPTLLL